MRNVLRHTFILAPSPVSDRTSFPSGFDADVSSSQTPSPSLIHPQSQPHLLQHQSSKHNDVTTKQHNYFRSRSGSHPINNRPRQHRSNSTRSRKTSVDVTGQATFNLQSIAKALESSSSAANLTEGATQSTDQNESTQHSVSGSRTVTENAYENHEPTDIENKRLSRDHVTDLSSRSNMTVAQQQQPSRSTTMTSQQNRRIHRHPKETHHSSHFPVKTKRKHIHQSHASPSHTGSGRTFESGGLSPRSQERSKLSVNVHGGKCKWRWKKSDLLESSKEF